MADYIERDALSLKVQRQLIPNVDVDGTVRVEDAERWFLKLIKEQPGYAVVDFYDDDFGLILNCAVRYCLGRQTYMPGMVIGYITPLLPRLTTRTLGVMKRDIESAGYYGDEKIDKPGWIRFLGNVTAELDRRDQK